MYLLSITYLVLYNVYILFHIICISHKKHTNGFVSILIQYDNI